MLCSTLADNNQRRPMSRTRQIGPFGFPEKRPLEVVASVCHSRESGNLCSSASLMDSRFRGNDRKLNNPARQKLHLTMDSFSGIFICVCANFLSCRLAENA